MKQNRIDLSNLPKIVFGHRDRSRVQILLQQKCTTLKNQKHLTQKSQLAVHIAIEAMLLKRKGDSELEKKHIDPNVGTIPNLNIRMFMAIVTQRW